MWKLGVLSFVSARRALNYANTVSRIIRVNQAVPILRIARCRPLLGQTSVPFARLWGGWKDYLGNLCLFETVMFFLTSADTPCPLIQRFFIGIRKQSSDGFSTSRDLHLQARCRPLGWVYALFLLPMSYWSRNTTGYNRFHKSIVIGLVIEFRGKRTVPFFYLFLFDSAFLRSDAQIGLDAQSCTIVHNNHVMSNC